MHFFLGIGQNLSFYLLASMGFLERLQYLQRCASLEEDLSRSPFQVHPLFASVAGLYTPIAR